MKKCYQCKTKKELKEFYKHPEMVDGHQKRCKECAKKNVRLNFKKNKEYYNKYDKDRIRNNFNYMFLHRYSSILAKTQGRAVRHYSVEGKRICSKLKFMNWCYSEDVMKKFVKLHNNWKINNYCRKLCPSIDRINNNKGYMVNNLQWITQQQNSSKSIK